jgi:hypothetical protein
MEVGVPGGQTPVQRALQLAQAIPRGRLRQRNHRAAQGGLPLGTAVGQSDRRLSTIVEPMVAPSSEEVSPSRSGTQFVPAPSVDQLTDVSGGVFADLHSIVVEVGDLVFIRYDDQPDRRLSIRLSNIESNPGDGVVHISQP